MTENEINLFKLRPNKIIRLLFKLSLMGIGVGVVIGSLMRIMPKYINAKDILNKSISMEKIKRSNSSKNVKYINFDKFNISRETNEIKALSLEWEKLSGNQKDLEASGYILFEDGRYAKLNSNKILPAASTIKVGVLLVVLQSLDKGDLSWDELLVLDKVSIAEGAGWMRYQKLGKEFPIHEVSTEMIRISDNTATNLLIKRVGGIEILNKRFKGIGLSETELKNLLPDLQGTNKTSTKDLANIIRLVDSGNILSNRSRDLFREIMSTSITNTLIPDGLLNGLGINQGNSDYKLLIEGFRVYNKTGDIGTTYADTALLQMPDSSRAFVAFIVKGPFNDQRSTNLIRKMSAAIIPYLKANQPSKTP